MVKPLLRPAYDYLSTRAPIRKYFTPPPTVQIEITTYCNLQCVGCFRTCYEYPGKNKHMPLDDFKYYVNQLEPGSVLYLNGIGEPTLHPDIRKIITGARSSGKVGPIQFLTNALAVKVTLYDELFALGLSGLGISVDSLNPQEADKLRPRTDIARLEENIRYLLDKYPDKINFIMVISKQNVDTFDVTIQKLVGFGARAIHCQPFDNIGTSRLSLSFEEKCRFRQKFGKIKYEGVHLEATASFSPTDQPCSSFNSSMITSDGYLAPCCRIINKDVFNLGSLKEFTLRELHNSATARSLRAQIDRGVYPEFCAGCMLNHAEFNASKWPEHTVEMKGTAK